MSARNNFLRFPGRLNRIGCEQGYQTKMRGAVSIIEFLKLITRPMPARLAAVVCAVKIALQLLGYDFGVTVGDAAARPQTCWIHCSTIRSPSEIDVAPAPDALFASTSAETS